jgi:hypothetical protein
VTELVAIGGGDPDVTWLVIGIPVWTAVWVYLTLQI